LLKIKDRLKHYAIGGVVMLIALAIVWLKRKK
jgi:LPXTG-motif cell wall-anchored protein